MFSEEEMRSDPEYAPPKITIIEDAPPAPQTNASDNWFESNKYERVPVIALESDPVQIPNQNYVCFSVIKPEHYRSLHYNNNGANNSYNGFLIKFRGVFKSKEDADKHIKRIMAIDKHFDVHLVPCFEWTGIDEDFVSDKEYADKTISEIMKGYFRNENQRLMGMRDRIAMTEAQPGDANYTDRSEEATRFFESAQARTIKNEPENINFKGSISLDALATQAKIDPKVKVVDTEHRISDGSKENIIAEVLLD